MTKTQKTTKTLRVKGPTDMQDISLIMANKLRQEYKGERKVKRGVLEQKTLARETRGKSENIVLGIGKFRSDFRKGNSAIW